MTPIFAVDHLTVRYGGVTALDDVSLEVQEGQVFGLIGPNGAGKTTLMDAVTGLTPSVGRVLLDGKDVNGLAPHRRVAAGLARTFQSVELFDDLSVRENLLAAAGEHRWWSVARDIVLPRPSSQALTRTTHALDLLGIADLADAMPTDLSLGQRKLVGVARSLARPSKVLLLDEPASGLDTGESSKLGEQLKDIAREGQTIVLIDHDMGLVLGVCDEVTVLDFGHRIAAGTPEQIRTDDRVIRAYLGADEADLAAEVAGRDDPN
jgi:ABC-type branched-subunit amino acid transport system ATPase component